MWHIWMSFELGMERQLYVIIMTLSVLQSANNMWQRAEKTQILQKLKKTQENFSTG